jgi:hypothetical protein
MARSMWKRALAAALLSAGIGGGYTWMCRAQAPAAADTVELSIEGKSTPCQLVHTWRDSAGKTLHIVFNQSSGEMLTLVPDGADGGVRIIHWGPGAQGPPPNTPTPQEWRFESSPLPAITNAPPDGYAPKIVNTPPATAAAKPQPAPTVVSTTPRPLGAPAVIEAQPTPVAKPMPQRGEKGLEVSAVRPPATTMPRTAVPSTMARYTLPDIPAASSLEIPGVPVVGASHPDNFPPASAYGPINYRIGANRVSSAGDTALVQSQAVQQPAPPAGAPPLPDIKPAPLPDVPAPPLPHAKMPAGDRPAAPLTPPAEISHQETSGRIINSCEVYLPCETREPRFRTARPRWVGEALLLKLRGPNSESIACQDMCQDACPPSPPKATAEPVAPPKEMPKPMPPTPPKETSTKIPGTNQPWPVGVQSAVAASGGMHGKVTFLPVPIATIPEPRRIPQPPNIVPQPPQPTRPDPMSVNAFTPSPAEQQAMMASMPGDGPMPGAMLYPMSPVTANPYGMMPYPNPYAMVAPAPMMPAPMMPTGSMAAPGYPMMPGSYPMMPGMYPGAPAMNPYAVPMMPSAPVNTAPAVQPASFAAYNNAMDRRIPTQSAYGPAHAKHLNYYIQVLNESSSPGEREWAANSLAGYDPHTYPQAVSALTHAAAKDANSGVRAACINNLSRMTLSHEHATRLISAFRHETDPRVKQEVDRALARLGVATTN